MNGRPVPTSHDDRIEERSENPRMCLLKRCPELRLFGSVFVRNARGVEHEGSIQQIRSGYDVADAIQDDGPLCAKDALPDRVERTLA